MDAADLHNIRKQIPSVSHVTTVAAVSIPYVMLSVCHTRDEWVIVCGRFDLVLLSVLMLLELRLFSGIGHLYSSDVIHI